MANLRGPGQDVVCGARPDHQVAGQTIQITEEQTASASPGSPVYCAVTGHINTYIGFEILLPVSTWRQRYLQVGCGGLCGSIRINPPQTTGYQPLADGDFVLAAEDDGHSGQGTSWYTNALQRVDFAYLSYHDVALVSKGLAQKFYGIAPRYSYFDGCSQGGHEALGEVQRYPTDFNGVLAGAPASIMTELNSVLHEYTYAANYSDGNYSTPDTHPILDQPEADIVLNAAMKACYPQVGLMLDYRACEQKFNLDSVECSATLTTQLPDARRRSRSSRKIWNGPVDRPGPASVPGRVLARQRVQLEQRDQRESPADAGRDGDARLVHHGLAAVLRVRDPRVRATSARPVSPTEPFTDGLLRADREARAVLGRDQPGPAAVRAGRRQADPVAGRGRLVDPDDHLDRLLPGRRQGDGGPADTQQFAKYYLLPSVGHCGGNGPDTYDGLGAVVAWTEKHISPNALVATQYAPATAAADRAARGGPGGGSPAI